MKTAISLPDELFLAADKLARDMGLSRSELYRTAISAFLVRHADACVTEGLDAVYGARNGAADAAPLDPVLDSLQRASLVREDW
jgi:predicted transcriptional regulator